MKKTRKTALRRGFNKDPRRGVSIAEAVVAMMLISIISVSAFTAIGASMRVNTRVSARFSSINLIGDCLECFKYGEDEESFVNALRFYGKEQARGDYEVMNLPGKSIYIFSEKAYTAVVTINFAAGTFGASSISEKGEIYYVFGEQDQGDPVPYRKAKGDGK